MYKAEHRIQNIEVGRRIGMAYEAASGFKRHTIRNCNPTYIDYSRDPSSVYQSLRWVYTVFDGHLI